MKKKFKKNPHKRFTSNKELLVGDLFVKETYNRILSDWRGSYFEVPKKDKIKIPSNLFDGDVQKLNEILMLLGIESIGGKYELESQIRFAQKNNSIDKVKAHRFRKKVNSIYDNGRIIIEYHDLVKELDDKIDEVYYQNIVY